jgi:Family of unknown function (DUF6481)
MRAYQDPSYQDRVGRAADAKRKALEQLRARPAVDPAVLAERQAARVARDEQRAAAKAARAEAKAQAVDASPNVATTTPPPTEEERKAARDARYAARKGRR